MVGYPRNVVVFLLASGSVGPEMLKLLKLNCFFGMIRKLKVLCNSSVAPEMLKLF